MTTYYAAQESVSTNVATELVAAADVDRTVRVNAVGGAWYGYDDTVSASTGVGTPELFYLPAGHSLWVFVASGAGSVTIQVLTGALH